VYGNEIFVSLITWGGTAPANVHSLLLLTQEEQDAWTEGELLWQRGDGVLVGFDGEDIAGDTLFVRVTQDAVSIGATRVADGNIIVIYTVSQGSNIYSRIVKYDNNFDIIWDRTLGEQDNETRIQSISTVDSAIIVTGRANHRFDTDESTTAPLDGFIYIIRVNQAIPATPLAVKNVTRNSIEFYPIQGAEFSIDNGATWQSETVFTGLNPATHFIATFRYAQTMTHNASPQIKSVVVSTLSLIDVIYRSQGVQIGITQTLTGLEHRDTPSSPTRLGYRFIGWEQSSSFTNDRWVFVFDAVWLREISVVFMNDEQQIGATQVVVNLEDVVFPTMTQEGYNFRGWSRVASQDCTIVTYTAIWTHENQCENRSRVNPITRISWILLGFSIALAVATLIVFIIYSVKKKNEN